MLTDDYNVFFYIHLWNFLNKNFLTQTPTDTQKLFHFYIILFYVIIRMKFP